MNYTIFLSAAFVIPALLPSLLKKTQPRFHRFYLLSFLIPLLIPFPQIERLLPFRYAGFEGTFLSLLARSCAELWFSTQNGLPIRSLKWVYTPQGILKLESNYYGDHLEIHLSAPQGQKRSRIYLKKPVFDFEQLFFLVAKWQNRNTASFPVFVPISGMVWKARLKKIQDPTTKKSFLVQIAGEKLYLIYEHEELYPSKVKAPQRGYQLVLSRVFSE